MKKITLLIVAICLAITSSAFAAGGNITYELNGGVTNDHGWTNKNDMYLGLNSFWNTFSSATTTWTSLNALVSTNGTAEAAVPKGIPTEASTMDLTFIQNTTVYAEWQWLVDYMDAVCTTQAKTLPSSSASFLRYNLSAFFLNSVRSSWPASADYSVAGQASAFMPTWKHAFTGPATYDGTTEITIPDPYKEGYTFDGWYQSSDFSGSKVTAIAVGTSGDITLYAKWIEYIPTCAEIWTLANGSTTKASGIITFIDGNKVYIQDTSAGLRVEFASAPSVSVGQKVTVTGTTSKLGTNTILTGATLVSSESSSLPDIQNVTLANIIDDAINSYKTYMFEYISMEGLTISSYDANGAIVTDGTNTIPLHITLNQTTFPIGTIINAKVNLSTDGTSPILVGDVSNIEVAPAAAVDPFTYPTRTIDDKSYTLTNKWLYSTNLDNFTANAPGTATYVRGMAAKDGKMYFVNRELKKLIVVDGSTGERLNSVNLASNIFTYTGRNKADTADSTYVAGTLPFNDIKIDNAGHVLLGNCITSNAGVFQIWKIDLVTGNGTLVLQDILKDYEDYADATIRFDAFGVYGDVDNNAIIMAANASAMEAYKWTITNGVAGNAQLVTIDTGTEGTYLTSLTNPGSAPQIFPLDENYFYLDGNATYPTLIDMSGNVVDGFYNNPTALIDSVTSPNDKWTMNVGHNGLIEFQLGDDYFFLMAATNTAGTPASTFRLFKWANANKEFSGLETMWTFPAAGMGSTSNSYRTAVPSVEVDETAGTATMYLYTGENGYGVYELGSTATGVKNTYNNDAVNIYAVGNTINLSKEVSEVLVYSIVGQLVAKSNDVSSIKVNNNGIYMVKATTYNGQTALYKVIVK